MPVAALVLVGLLLVVLGIFAAGSLPAHRAGGDLAYRGGRAGRDGPATEVIG